MSNPLVDKVEAAVKAEAKKSVTVPLWVLVVVAVVSAVVGHIL